MLPSGKSRKYARLQKSIKRVKFRLHLGLLLWLPIKISNPTQVFTGQRGKNIEQPIRGNRKQTEEKEEEK